MSNDSNPKNLDDILSALTVSVKATKESLKEVVSKEKEIISDDELYNDIVSAIFENINYNKQVIEEAKDLATSIGDAELIEAYATVSKSQSDLIKTLASLLSDRQKMKLTEKLKERDIEAKKELLVLKGESKQLEAGQTNIQNNFFIKGTREEMFNALFGEGEKKEKAQQKFNEQLENPPIDI